MFLGCQGFIKFLLFLCSVGVPSTWLDVLAFILLAYSFLIRHRSCKVGGRMNLSHTFGQGFPALQCSEDLETTRTPDHV